MIDNITAGLIGFLIGLFIIGLGVLVTRYINQNDKRLSSLEQDNQQLKTKLDQYLAVKTRSRQTGPTLAGIENIQAALIRIKYERNYQDELLDASLRTLSEIRKGPYAYDPNTPCTERKEKPCH